MDLVMNGKIPRELCDEKMKPPRQGKRRSEAPVKTSGPAGVWTQFDMNTLSVSWKLPVDRSAPRGSEQF
jgi:hypothetical protein